MVDKRDAWLSSQVAVGWVAEAAGSGREEGRRMGVGWGTAWHTEVSRVAVMGDVQRSYRVGRASGWREGVVAGALAVGVVWRGWRQLARCALWRNVGVVARSLFTCQCARTQTVRQDVRVRHRSSLAGGKPLPLS